MKRLFLAVAFLLLLPVSAHADTVDTLMAESRELVAEKEFAKALAVLEQAQTIEPANDDIRLAMARIYGWQGNYDAAERELNGILSRNPSYADAKDALNWVQNARNASPELAPYDWQVDSGLEYSDFRRQPQSSWNQEFVQVNRMLGDTVVHARIDRYDEFDSLDSAYEVGVNQNFTKKLNGYLLTSVSPDAQFRPRWRVGTGGAARVDEDWMRFMPSWITLDTLYDEYPLEDVRTINPGLRFEPAEDWALSPEMITVQQIGANVQYGWQLRLDGRFTRGWRFDMGVADAPDTEAGITVRTKTVFAGLAIDIDPAHTLRVAYTHDDRDSAYIRHVIDASLSYRF